MCLDFHFNIKFILLWLHYAIFTLELEVQVEDWIVCHMNNECCISGVFLRCEH